MKRKGLLDREGFNLPFGRIDERTKPSRDFLRHEIVPANFAKTFAATLHQGGVAVRKGRGHNLCFRADRLSRFQRQPHDDGGAGAEHRADAHCAAV
jgi:hypothetical protein